MKVLLVVDVQNDFCPGGNLAVGGGDSVVPVINRLMSSGHYDHVIASQDWHPQNHGSFASNNGVNPFEMGTLNGLPQMFWPDHCVQNSHGAEFHPDLDVSHIEKVIQKGLDPEVDSYSAFFDNGKRHETELSSYLKTLAESAGISLSDIELDCVGLATDYCVAYSARDAHDLGIRTGLILDACRAISADAEHEVVREFAEKGIRVIESREIVGEHERSVDLAEGSRGREQGLNA